jgi:hypothetical protein
MMTRKWKREKSSKKNEEKVCENCKYWDNSALVCEKRTKIIKDVTRGYRKMQPHFDPETVEAVNDRTSCIDDHFGVPVYCPFKEEPINIDFHIAPLIALVWACGIATSCSCEGYFPESSYISIEFYGDDLNRFLQIVFEGEPMNDRRVNKALGESQNDLEIWASFLRISFPKEKSDGNTDSENDGKDLIHSTRTYTTLLFPKDDYEFVLSKFQKEYARRKRCAR